MDPGYVKDFSGLNSIMGGRLSAVSGTFEIAAF